MRLSTKTRYGVRALFDIAFHGQDPSTCAVQAKDIARRESIPLRYLEQIFQDLKKAGLVDSKRGPRGGYFLKRPPDQILLSEIIASLQGPITEMFVVEDDDEEPAQSLPVTGALWKELADHVSSWFSGITLAELVRRGNELGLARGEPGQLMYFI